MCLLSQSVADRLDISQSILCCTNSSFELWQQLEITHKKKELLNDLKCGGEQKKRTETEERKLDKNIKHGKKGFSYESVGTIEKTNNWTRCLILPQIHKNKKEFDVYLL